MVHSQGLEDRKAEKARSKRVKELIQDGQEVPPELLICIIDREKVQLEARQLQEEQAQLDTQLAQDSGEDEEVLFTIDTLGDPGLVPKLDQDYIPFPSLPPEASQRQREASSSSIEPDKGDSDSEVYNKEMDYSWDNRK